MYEIRGPVSLHPVGAVPTTGKKCRIWEVRLLFFWDSTEDEKEARRQ
jgi:hypothetical protein